ncbi:5'/3'-nucleotidase SurE [Brevibacillus laterosporus]|uniref:5'/3'-nucleotidase SurE n=1 Tax=Brevibacillus TaxID=55080 RepID=UPI0002404834|nr:MULTISPECIES: 5'/3'-nucleotidase SurE [Brevibacillus]MBA4534168.1 5'/3'-nucleotidase SurE [Brevibacillus halotolerans]MDF9413033.1 5'/3'-nucleotidase SurE [Brevibacillus laterosporus]PCN42242.1 5'/3'-nucleotidase SurE [Brevibacillus laterosporus]CCF13117.1 5'/3'-nucleotidase SurE [Brevibacillus laterosporus GI-9]
MRILLTNDDGIEALGIRTLAEALLPLQDLEIYVVAPSEERSGVGHGVTFREALAPAPHDFYGLPVKAWSVNGNPADCVKAAYYLLFKDQERPDLVLSGINVGANLGKDVYYSGTCSAAREAVILGIPAVALSYDNYHNPTSFGEVGKIIEPLLKQFMEQTKQKQMPPKVFWNVNVPDLPKSQIKGITPAVLAFDFYHDVYSPSDSGYFLGREYPERMEKQSTEEDFQLVKQGYTTVTPIHIDSTDRKLLEQMKEWPLLKK